MAESFQHKLEWCSNEQICHGIKHIKIVLSTSSNRKAGQTAM